MPTKPELNIDLSGLGHGPSTRNVLIIDGAEQQLRVDEIGRNGGAAYHECILAIELPLHIKSGDLSLRLMLTQQTIRRLLSRWDAESRTWSEDAGHLAYQMEYEISAK